MKHGTTSLKFGDAVSSLNNSRAQHKQMDLAIRLHYQPNNS